MARKVPDLLRWLEDHHEALVTNGYGVGSTRPDSTTALQAATTIAPAFAVAEHLYQALLAGAAHHHDQMQTTLRELTHRTARTAAELHDMIALVQHIRQSSITLLQQGNLDADARFTLLLDLDTLLDETIVCVTDAWATTSEATTQAQVADAEFIAAGTHAALAEADQSTMKLALLNDISRRLSASLEQSDPTDIITFVGSKLHDVLAVSHISFWLPVPDEQHTIRIEAHQAWSSSSYAPVPTNFVPCVCSGTHPDDLLLTAYRTGSVQATTTPLDTATQGEWYIAGQHVLAIPLMVNEQATGVVALQDDSLNEKLSLASRDTLQTIITQMAIALDNARLYGEVQRFNSDLEQLVTQRSGELKAEKERLETLYMVASEVSSTLDLDSLLNRSLQVLASMIGVHYGSIMLLDLETEHLVPRAKLGGTPPDPNAFNGFPLGHGVAGWVARHKEPALIGDVTVDERWVPGMFEEVTTQTKRAGSMLAVPLIAHDERLGVLTLSHEESHFFHDGHLRLMMASAGTIAMGIYNARMYNTILDSVEQRSERLRKQQFETSTINAILQSLADGVIVCDIDGSILTANPAGATILNRPVETLILANMHDLLPELLMGRVDAMPLDDLLQRPTDSRDNPRMFEYTLQQTLRTIKLLLGPVLREDGELVGALLTLRDISRETEADRLKSEFIGTMSHELRTPMTSIKGFTQLLAMGGLGPLNDTQREFVQTIQTNAERMISLINDVMELNKIESGNIQLEFRPLHLAEVLSGVVSEVQQLATKRDIALDLEIPPGLPLVYADATRLHQVLYNLLSNAVKYTPGGGAVRVVAHETHGEDLPPTIRDRVIADRRYTQIDVQDTGVGIAPADLGRIFDRFYRTENALKVEAGGTGLGLSLARPLIQMQGGSIWAESEEGVGSTFSFILPAVDQTPR